MSGDGRVGVARNGCERASRYGGAYGERAGRHACGEAAMRVAGTAGTGAGCGVRAGRVGKTALRMRGGNGGGSVFKAGGLGC